MNGSRLERHTWRELEVAAPPLLIVPVGSCEQHGPHLPLDTDTQIARAIAGATAAQVPGAVVTEPIAFAASGEHAGFPGTLSIGTDALTAVLIELVRSADWAEGVVFVNGHGGNHEAIRGAVDVSTHDGRRVLAWWPRLAGADAHAGRAETSIMLALAPADVRVPLAEPGATQPVSALLDALRRDGVRPVSPNGVLGDPGGASAEEGRDMLDEMIADAVARVRAWRERPACG